MSRQSRLISSLLTGFTVAFYFALVLPVQTYLANADSFNYTLGALLGDLFLPQVLTFAVASLALFFLSRWVGQFLHILLLALVVAAFAESGPLSIGLPELNGDFSGYKSLTRAIWDWSILLGIVLIPLWCYRWIRGSATWIALALTVYLGATLFDVKVKSQRPEGMEDFIVPRLVPRTDVVRSAEFSPKRNVIMLILDSISVDACVDAFAADPDLASHFTGFVNYTNNVGMMWTTNRAIPALFEGKCCESESDMPRFGMAPFRQDSFIKPYLENNCPIYLNLSLYKDGFTNRVKHDDSGMLAPKPSPFSDRMHGMYPMTLPELASFRMLPYFVKESFVLGLDAGTNSVATSSKQIDVNRLWEDGYLWQELASKPVNPQVDLTLHVHLTRGGHPPTKYDRDGAAVSGCGLLYSNHVEQCVYAYRQVARMLDVWKTNGVYDASLIFVIADHSHNYKKPGANYQGMNVCAFPSLMVKASNSSWPLRCDGRPTSHAGISKLIRKASLTDVTAHDVEEALYSAERRCVGLTNDKKIVWTVDANGVVRKCSTLDKPEPAVSDMKPLTVGKMYSFRPEDNAYPDYHVEGGLRGAWAGTMGSNMEFSFKVSDRHARYDCEFELYFIEGHRVVARSDDGGDSILVSNGYGRKVSRFDNVMSDGQGVIKLSFVQPKSEQARFALSKLRLLSAKPAGGSRTNSLVKVLFDPQGGFLDDNIRYVRHQDRYGWNCNIYPARQASDFSNLQGISFSNGWFVACLTNDTKSSQWANYFNKKLLADAEKGAAYTYVVEVDHSSGRCGGWDIGQTLPSNQNCRAQIPFRHISFPVSNTCKFLPMKLESFPAYNYFERSYLWLKPEDKIDVRFRIAYFGGVISEKNYVYVRPGSAIWCDLPMPTRKGYVFDGWYSNDQLITTDSRVELHDAHVLKARWKRK